MGVEREGEVVGTVADQREPLVVLHHHVVLVAVQDQEAAAVACDMDMLVTDLDLAEIFPQEATEHLVVIAGQEHHLGALARLAQQLLQHVVMALFPGPGALHAPDIDDIADQVEIIGFRMLQKIEQILGLTSLSPKVNVGNPDCPVTVDALLAVHLPSSRF